MITKLTFRVYKWWGLILMYLDATKATAIVVMTNQKAKVRNASSSGNMSRNAGNQE